MNKRLTISLILIVVLTLSVAGLMIGCSPDTNDGSVQTEQTTTAETLGVAYPTLMHYEDYLKLSPQLQQAYYESFPSPELYMQWFNAAVQAYNQEETGESAQEGAGNEGQITEPTEQQEGADKTPVTPTEKPVTSASQPDSGNTKFDPAELTYEEYMKMSSAQQQAFYESFPSADAYMQWFNQATTAHKQEQTKGEQTQTPTTPQKETINSSSLEGIGAIDIVVPPLP